MFNLLLQFTLKINCLSNSYKVNFDKQWIYLASKENTIPTIGWKIHISASPVDFWKIVERVSKIVIEKKILLRFRLIIMPC